MGTKSLLSNIQVIKVDQYNLSGIKQVLEIINSEWTILQSKILVEDCRWENGHSLLIEQQ